MSSSWFLDLSKITKVSLTASQSIVHKGTMMKEWFSFVKTSLGKISSYQVKLSRRKRLFMSTRATEQLRNLYSYSRVHTLSMLVLVIE